MAKDNDVITIRVVGNILMTDTPSYIQLVEKISDGEVKETLLVGRTLDGRKILVDRNIEGDIVGIEIISEKRAGKL